MIKKISKLKSFSKTIIAPADKSITQRAILFSSLAQLSTKTIISNALLGLDCLSTIECVRQLGANVAIDNAKNIVEVTAGSIKNATLNVGNSGTAMRLIMGALAGQKGYSFTIDGDSSIRKRPMARVSELLEKMGAKVILSNDKYAPISIQGTNLIGQNLTMPIASAQVKSAVLLAGLFAKGTTSITEPTKSRDHTERLLQYFDVPVEISGNTAKITQAIIKPKNTHIVGDISSAAFSLVLAACIKNAKVLVKNVGLNPTRCGILDVLNQIGASVSVQNVRHDYESFGDIKLEYNSNLLPFCIQGDIVVRLIDEIPILATLACFIKGTSIIKDASELKVKESNRIDTVFDMLSAMGADIEKTTDGMVIHGTGKLAGGAKINTNGDHRIAMAAAVTGAASDSGVEIVGAECANVSYPKFYDMFN